MRQFNDPKDPDDSDDFGFDWARRLAAGETITGCTCAVVAGSVTLASPNATISGTTTTVRVQAGDDGSEADVRFRLTTSANRQLDETARIIVRSR